MPLRRLDPRARTFVTARILVPRRTARTAARGVRARASLMTVFPRHVLRLVAVVALTAIVPAAQAQHAAFRTVDTRPEGLVVEVTATWPLPLKAALDSTGAAALTAGVAGALSGGLFEAVDLYELPALVPPRVRVLSSDYDEVPLPAAADAGEVLAALGRPTVEAVGLGRARKRPVVNLVARLLAYDEARGVLRRYRRIVVALDYGTSVLARPGAAEAAASNPHLQVTRSVLADGIVYKIPITREGIYRIDRDFLSALPDLGLSPDNIEPNDVRVYGNGGQPLPALNGAPRPADLVENPVFVQGGGDGAFNAGDYVLFYAAPPRGWVQRLVTSGGVTRAVWEHYVNPFSNENYYFIKIGGGASQRVGDPVYPDFPDARPLTQVTGRYVRDLEEFLWSKENPSGLDWMSRTIRPGSSRAVLENVVLPGLAGGEVRYEARVAIRSNPVATVQFTSGGGVIGQARALRATSSATEAPVAYASEYTFVQTVGAGAPLNVSMQFAPQTSGSPEAALDWLRVFYPQALRAAGDTLRFATPLGEAGRFDFALTGFSREPHVWDVTEPGAIRRLGVRRSGDAYHVQVEVPEGGQPRELIAFVDTWAQRPATAGVQRVTNQNLHGIETYPDFVIVTPEAFRQSADELAAYRRQQGLDVLVVDINQIYNEFSGGLRDMRAVRDYFKFLYDRADDEARLFRYALLFGDGHFNFRNLGDATQQATFDNWIPPFQTDDSLDPDASYTSDDYFGLLDDDEGIWRYGGHTDPGTEHVDIGIGRFPVQTAEEAATIVRKIKHYENPATYGAWRTRYTFVADDGYNGLSATLETQPDLHTQNADVVANLVRQRYPSLNLKKIYAISYDRTFLNGWKIPGAKRDVLAAIEEGTLVFNYSGHGGEDGLAQEEIFTREDAIALNNLDRMPVFVTATCSFGWWDLGREQSAAEVLFLNPNGGAIALLTTVRLVYTSASLESLNVGLNRALNQYLFMRDEDGRPLRLGDALRLTKNTTAGSQHNNRKFNLLGDPTMRVGLPAATTEIEQINGKTTTEPAQLRALERITLSGVVKRPDGQVDAGFNGQVQVTVYDAERQVAIPPGMAQVLRPPHYTVREDLIWRGIVPATNGQFQAVFVVPKDISYSNQPGRITAYAYSADVQANGYTENLLVGGTAENPLPDDEGPRIELFLNDTTFVNGGLARADAKLIVKLEDESGINTVGAGVGHEMLLVIDGDERNAVDLSSTFESEPNSYQRGQATFSLASYPGELADGPHTLSVRAWDVANNASAATLEFYLTTAEELVLRNVYNYPNPMNGQTRFIFEHNQPPGTPAEVQVRIYTLAGRPVRTFETDEALPAGVLTGGPVQVTWDGRDEDFDPVATGVYLYKVRVSVEGADGTRHVSEKIEKLAVIR